MNFNFIWKGRRFSTDVKKAGLFSFGLMFKTRKTENLLFDFSSRLDFTSLFVFFSFVILWLDNKNRVIGFKVAKPFTMTLRAPRRYYRVLELPINSKNEKITRFFVGKTRKKAGN